MQPRRGRSLAKILLRNAAERVPGMWRTRFEVKALLEKSEHTRRRVAEIQRQLQDLILYWEGLLRRQGHTEAGPEQTSLQRGPNGEPKNDPKEHGSLNYYLCQLRQGASHAS